MNTRDLKTKDQIGQEIADRLRGTCTESIPEEYQDDMEVLRAIDDQVFVCAECEWWCGTDELSEDDGSGEQFCDECRPEDDS